MTYLNLFAPDPEEVERELRERQSHSSYTMRPYQAEAVRSVFHEWESGRAVTLVCLPTGTGKTVVFSEILRQYAESIR